MFIERSPERCAQLELLKQEFPDLAKDIQIRRGDANSEIQELCSKDWSAHRAVLLLAIPVEGRVVRGFEGADVGDQIRVRLMSVNVERGFIDFARVDLAGHA